MEKQAANMHILRYVWNLTWGGIVSDPVPLRKMLIDSIY